MAVTSTPTLLLDTTALTGTEATIYTAPAGTGLTAIIRNIHLCNNTGADRQFYLGKTAFAAGTAIFSGFVVPANDAYSLDVYIGLTSSQTLRSYTTLGGGVTIMLMGVV